MVLSTLLTQSVHTGAKCNAQIISPAFLIPSVFLFPRSVSCNPIGTDGQILPLLSSVPQSPHNHMPTETLRGVS